MGKNNKHKKKLKSEKAKVKLKSEKTKFLPKGQNVTDASFKIKPIVLVQQLGAKTSNEVLSKRKLNVKVSFWCKNHKKLLISKMFYLQELLTRLKHHNVNAKVDSCEGLSSVINEYPEEILEKHLFEIIQNASHLILDREQKPRKAYIKLINTLLKHVSKF